MCGHTNVLQRDPKDQPNERKNCAFGEAKFILNSKRVDRLFIWYIPLIMGMCGNLWFSVYLSVTLLSCISFSFVI